MTSSYALALIFTPFVFGLGLLIAGSVYGSIGYQYDNFKTYQHKTCNLQNVTVSELENCYSMGNHWDTRYIALWKNYNGYTVLDGPYESKQNKELAIQLSKKYSFNTNIECLCPSSVGYNYPAYPTPSKCDIIGTCYLNTQKINQYIKDANNKHNTARGMFIAGAVIIAVFAVLYVIIYCINKCWY